MAMIAAERASKTLILMVLLCKLTMMCCARALCMILCGLDCKIVL